MNASFIRSIISSAFVYFECVLLATQICTQFAARHEPKHNQDFILILGCQIRKDGTPTPLLKGRIERAMEFHKKQLAENGKTAIFIPTGGKGGDEIISEGECMKNYLLEHGIPENLICAETESATTLENMIFSELSVCQGSQRHRVFGIAAGSQKGCRQRQISLCAFH